MKRINYITTVLLIMTSITASVAFSQNEMELKAKVEKVNKAYADALLNSSTEKFAALFTDDAIELPSYEGMHEGIAAIRNANGSNFKAGWKATEFDITLHKIIPSDKLITEIGTYKITWTMPGMQKPTVDKGKFVTIFEKQKDGSLKIKVQIWNSDINPMASSQGMEKSKK
jgi:ketosteroid isomerase-like protein